MNQEKELYKGSINVRLKQPSLTVVSLNTRSFKNTFYKIADASKRRHFILNEDWEVELSNISYLPDLNGQVKIPKIKNNKPFQLDGASAPVAWLANFMSIGVVRPMGIMFNASIIHDYCYNYGGLEVSNDNGANYSFVKVNRDTADKLFRDIISSIHGMPRAAWLCWFLVKIGWVIGVGYNGKSWGKPAPKFVIVTILLILTSLGFFLFDSNGLITDRFHPLISYTFTTLFVAYILITVIARTIQR